MGNGGCDGSEWCVAFAFQQQRAQCAAPCGDACGADERCGWDAEGGLGIGIEPYRVGGEAELGGEDREGGVGAGGGDEGGERFEGAHAANLVGEFEGSGCEIMRGGTKDCVVARACMRDIKGTACLRGGVPFPS